MSDETPPFDIGYDEWQEITHEQRALELFGALEAALEGDPTEDLWYVTLRVWMRSRGLVEEGDPHKDDAKRYDPAAMLVAVDDNPAAALALTAYMAYIETTLQDGKWSGRKLS